MEDEHELFYKLGLAYVIQDSPKVRPSKTHPKRSGLE